MKVRISYEDRPAFPTWIRIVAGSVGAVTGAMAFWTHPHDFLTGISLISTALFLFFMRFRQPTESLQEYIVKPRSMITLVFPVIAGICALACLVRQFR
jgi:hypothetical protein